MSPQSRNYLRGIGQVFTLQTLLSLNNRMYTAVKSDYFDCTSSSFVSYPHRRSERLVLSEMKSLSIEPQEDHCHLKVKLSTMLICFPLDSFDMPLHGHHPIDLPMSGVFVSILFVALCKCSIYCIIPSRPSTTSWRPYPSSYATSFTDCWRCAFRSTRSIKATWRLSIASIVWRIRSFAPWALGRIW